MIKGLAISAACLLLALAVRYIWKRIPTSQCARCHSYDTMTNDSGLEECNDCGLVWEPEGSTKES